jgi:hypothetical protein
MVGRQELSLLDRVFLDLLLVVYVSLLHTLSEEWYSPCPWMPHPMPTREKGAQ